MIRDKGMLALLVAAVVFVIIVTVTSGSPTCTQVKVVAESGDVSAEVCQ